MNAVSTIDRESAEPVGVIDRRHDSLMRIAEVRRRTGLSTTSIYRREAEGTFPRKVPIGAKSVAWYLSDVETWVAAPANYRS